MSKEDICDMELDALKEVANIGAGNAATALSNMVNKKIDIEVPDVKYIKIESVPDLIGGIEEIAIGTYFGIEGDLKGNNLILFRESTAYRLVDMLMGSTGTNKLDEMGESAVKEVGNILTGAYLNAIADFLELKLIPTVPYLCHDMAGAMLNQILAEQSQYSDLVLVTGTNLKVENEKFKSHFIIIFDPGSMKKTIKIIRKKMGI